MACKTESSKSQNEPRETQYYHFDRKQRCLGEVAVIRGTAPIIKKDTHSEEAKQEKYTNDGKTAIIQQTVASDSTKSSKLFGAAIEEMASFPGGSAALMQYIAQISAIQTYKEIAIYKEESLLVSLSMKTEP